LVSIRTEVGDIWRSESEVDHHSDRRRGNPRYESEVSHHSDRKSGYPEVRVRSRSLFGQEKRKSRKTSPKSAPIRTGKVDIHWGESEA